jgi:hypothetical protein
MLERIISVINNANLGFLNVYSKVPGDFSSIVIALGFALEEHNSKIFFGVGVCFKVLIGGLYELLFIVRAVYLCEQENRWKAFVKSTCVIFLLVERVDRD